MEIEACWCLLRPESLRPLFFGLMPILPPKGGEGYCPTYCFTDVTPPAQLPNTPITQVSCDYLPILNIQEV